MSVPVVLQSTTDPRWFALAVERWQDLLLDHANWSPIDGRRGQIERDVLAVDVSPANDWSAVRVWYHPLGALGRTEWPVEGFIYSDRARSAPVRP